MIPHGALSFAGNATAQTFNNTAAKVVNTANGPFASSGQGDLTVTPDAANNRLLLERGLFFVSALVMINSAVAGTVTLQLRRAGAVVAQLIGSVTTAVVGGGQDYLCGFSGLLKITDAHMDATLATQAIVDLMGTSSVGGGQACTISNGQINVLRLDGE